VVEEKERKEINRIELIAGRGEEGVVFGGMLPIYEYVTEFPRHKNVGTRWYTVIQQYESRSSRLWTLRTGKNPMTWEHDL
jgi:hypothetical protein